MDEESINEYEQQEMTPEFIAALNKRLKELTETLQRELVSLEESNVGSNDEDR